MSFHKLILVTRKTQLEELIERHGTREQAAFLLRQRGQSLDDLADAHARYTTALSQLQAAIPSSLRSQLVERQFLPNFLFGPNDLIVTLGQDGLVVNTAKYLSEQPIIAFNPDPSRIDGVLVPFQMKDAADAIDAAINGVLDRKEVTMARATLDDGQTLDAVNDLFVGISGHASARYRLEFGDYAEEHSSSGVIISTGAGSTGWYRSIVTGAFGVSASIMNNETLAEMKNSYRFEIDARELRFSVREPFVSQTSGAELVYGKIEAGQPLEIISRMPQRGILFSDGMESDYLKFDNGMRATITIAPRRVQLYWR
jgi:NAD kinase